MGKPQRLLCNLLSSTEMKKKQKQMVATDITWVSKCTKLFRPIALLCGTDSQQNILHIKAEHENIPHNIVSPIEHCYGFE